MKKALLLTGTIVALAIGCHGTGSTGVKLDEAGGYFLVSVNGANVPAVTLQNATIKQEIISGSFFIGLDGTFLENRTGRITLTGGTPSQVVSLQAGTWTRSGNQFTFRAGTPTAPITFVGTVSGGVLTYTTADATYKYQKALPD